MHRSSCLSLCLLVGCGSGPADTAAGRDAATGDVVTSTTDAGVRSDDDSGTGDATVMADASDTDAAMDTDAGNGPNVMFVTSSAYSSNLGGIAGGDKICAAAASSAGLPGKFVAWLSTSTTDAISRLGTARGWTRTDGQPFVDTQANLVAGRIFYPPEVDEYGSYVFDNWIRTMTGTLGDGTKAPNTCKDWTSADPADIGDYGLGTTVVGAWTSSQVGAWPDGECGTEHLYCFQIDHQTPVTVPAPSSARLAFVSTTTVAATGGLAGGDAACTKDAAAAGLPGTYKAMMGTSTTTPMSRFSLTGPTWARVDGALLWLSAKDIGTVDPLTGIAVRADGSIYGGNGWVGSGNTLASTVNIPGDGNCEDWSSTSGSELSYLGTAAYSSWWLYTGGSCDTPLPVFCFQE